MTKFELQQRTKKFHVDVIRLCEFLPKNASGFETAKQLIRSAGSVGANYRAACRGKSQADFIYKIEVVLEEADESLSWLEIPKDTCLIPPAQLNKLYYLVQEASELVRIFNATDITAKRNRNQLKSKNKKQMP